MLEDNNLDCGPTRATIAQEIERLNAWQEQQLQVLQERQNEQRRQLHLEQKSMYELMGFRTDDKDNDDDDDEANKDKKDMENDEIKINKHKVAITEEKEIYPIGDCEPKKNRDRCEAIRKKNKIYEIANVFERLSLDKGDGMEPPTGNKPKRQFLRRGEGLRQRFKVDPDEFKLDKLPRYKYANAHPHLRSATSLRSLKLRTKTSKRNAPQKSPPRLTIEEEEAECEDDSLEKLAEPAPFPKLLESQEKRFQQLLITSKNVYNSTPETKTHPLVSPKEVNKNSPIPKAKPAKKSIRFGQSQEIEQPKMSWAKVLDSQKIQAVSVPELRCKGGADTGATADDTDNLSIFELLEERAQNGTINLDESCIARFIGKNLKNAKNAVENCDDDDTIPVQPELRNAGLKPIISKASIEVCSDNVERDYASHFADVIGDTRSNDSDRGDRDSDDDENVEGDEGDDGNDGDGDNSDDDDQDDEDDNYSGYHSSSGSYESIEPNNGLFQQFKEVLFSVLNQRASKAEYNIMKETKDRCKLEDNTIDSTTTNIVSEITGNDSALQTTDTQNSVVVPQDEEQTTTKQVPASAMAIGITASHEEQLNSVRQRNAELEREVASFKDANTQLTKLKQEFDLEKALFVQERQESLDELNDIKVKFEMYMHDERVKFEDEKRKYELHLRTQRLTNQNKDRREIAHLREEVEKLQQQIRQKEQTHAAAQARLRTQINKFEKDQKHLLEEIEQLKKDNKKLESECARMEREHNNKMLDTINKNIAKLAPKMPSPEITKPGQSLDETSIKPILRKQRQSLLPTNLKSASQYGRTKKKTKKIITPQPPNSPRNNSDSTDDVDDDDNEAAAAIENAIMDLNLKSSTSKYNLKKTPTTVLNVNENESKVIKEHTNDNDNNNNNNNTDNKGNHKSQKLNGSSHQMQMTLKKTTENVCATPTNVAVQMKASNSNAEFQREIVNADGSKDIWYSNGNLQKVSADGMYIRMLYYNKDIKETDIENGTVKYYYAATNTWHTTYLDGLEILEFPNGQIEHRHKNGVIEIHFPNNSIKILNPADENKEAEWRFEDGTQLVQMRNGDKILTLPNGQKEIHTKLNKRREYPDGTVKIVYPDGSQETRYSNGRVRLKDKDGKLIMDSDTVHGGGRR